MDAFAQALLRDPEIKLALSNIEAWGLTAIFNPASVSIYAVNGLLLIELSTRAHILHFTREMGYIDAPSASNLASATIARLEAELAAERALRQNMADEKARLERRLFAAEQKLKRLGPSNGAAYERYTKLKNFLAKEFHPDHPRGTALERQVRAEFFKILWAKVEDIDR